MTYVEVDHEVQVWKRRNEAAVREQLQIRAAMDYQLAALIGKAVAQCTKGVRSFPKDLKEAYPGLFADAPSSWRESKDRFQKFAEEFNRQRGGGTA